MFVNTVVFVIMKLINAKTIPASIYLAPKDLVVEWVSVYHVIAASIKIVLKNNCVLKVLALSQNAQLFLVPLVNSVSMVSARRIFAKM